MKIFLQLFKILLIVILVNLSLPAQQWGHSNKNEISNSTLKVDTIPDVSTSNVTFIGLYSATRGSNITSDGGQSVAS